MSCTALPAVSAVRRSRRPSLVDEDAEAWGGKGLPQPAEPGDGQSPIKSKAFSGSRFGELHSPHPG